MLSVHIRLIAAAALFGLFPLRLTAAPDTQHTQPASAPYVEAIGLVKQLAAGPDARKLNGDAPLNAATVAFLNNQSHIFDLLHAGAVAHSTEWGVGDGMDIQRLLPQLNGVRQLTGMVILRARSRWMMQDSAQAQEDFLDALAMSRNIAREHPILIVKLVLIANEQNVLQHWAKLLPATPADQLAQLPGRLSELPPPGNFADVLSAEQNFAANHGQMPPDVVKGMAPFYDTAKEVDQTPAPSPEQFKKDLLDAAAKLTDPISNSLANVAAVSFSTAGINVAANRVYLEMFKTGINFIHDGSSAVQASVDPFGTGPFEYSPTAHGFQLRSKLVLHGKPVTMDFGS